LQQKGSKSLSYLVEVWWNLLRVPFLQKLFFKL